MVTVGNLQGCRKMDAHLDDVSKRNRNLLLILFLLDWLDLAITDSQFC